MSKFVKIFVFKYINKEYYGLKSIIYDFTIENNKEEINKTINNILNDNKNESNFGGINIIENNNILEIIDSHGNRRKLTKQETIEHRRSTFPPEATWKSFTINECENCTCNKNKKCNGYSYNKNNNSFSFNPLYCRVLLEKKGAKINKKE